MPGSLERHQEACAAAVAQAGVISHDQLVHDLGWPAGAIRTQLDAHRWQRVFSGVYAVSTGDLPVQSLWWAAHLRCGETSALSGDSALQAWRITPPSRPIEMAVPFTSSARTPGLTIHRTRDSLATRCPKRLPPTVLPQLAVLLVSDRLEPAGVMDLISSACQQGRVSPAQIERGMRDRRVRHRKLIMALLAEVRGGATTPLEITGTTRILQAHGLPTGLGQVRDRRNGRAVVRDRLVGGLIIEFDGRLGHSDPHGRFRDLDRDNAAVLTGRPTLRFGWTDVHQDPCRAADQIVEALANLGTSPRLRPCSDTCSSRFVERAGS